MNIRDLKYLIALADNNHFSKAALACFVSQPALSMQIKKLEDDLGVQLIERSNKRFFFTAIGKRIVEQAREILCRVEALHHSAQQSKDPFSGELHLGIIPTLAPYLLSLIIPHLMSLFPNLRLYLVEDTTGNLLQKLKDGLLDAALLALPIEGAFQAYPLFEEAFVLALPLGHPLSEQTTVTLSDLEHKSLLLLEDGHCLREQALAVCHQVNAKEINNFRATSLETLRHMVAAGIGLTLMPKLACREDDKIKYLSFQSPSPARMIGLLCRQSTEKKMLMDTLAQCIKDILSNNSSSMETVGNSSLVPN
ncbi:MAG: DNA-binding transcriptional regulator OxyR [Legionella sp.]|nr:DNA-binding transcriptional regulator OxyR [Legionella sp.]